MLDFKPIWLDFSPEPCCSGVNCSLQQGRSRCRGFLSAVGTDFSGCTLGQSDSPAC